MSIPLWLQCTHLQMANSSRIMHHVTKLKSSKTGFVNMTMSSLYSNGLHCHQISIQQSTFGMWCNGRFASWIMSIWTKISEKCFQHLVESMPRRIKAVLKAKGGPTRTSKVYLIKWPVSVYICVSLNIHWLLWWKQNGWRVNVSVAVE